MFQINPILYDIGYDMAVKVAADEAREVATGLLVAFGAPAEHAHIQADLLVEAEMRGHPSHGLLRLPRLLERMRTGLINPAASGEHSWHTTGMLRVDGQHGFGPVVAMHALDALVERARQTGIAIAAIRNANHIGMLAYYVEKAARDGMIVLALSTSEALVHPFGGKRAMLGTNPLAIGIPAAPRPFILDLATGTVSMGKIHDHALRGAEIPVGWALDRDGNPTTDATAAKAGSLAPFGAAKGYGIGLAIELLVASLAGSALAPDVHGTLDAEHLANKGDVFIVIDPPAQPHLSTTIAAYLDALRSTPPQQADRPVSVPGDGAYRRRTAALQNGLEIDADLWATLTGILSTPLTTTAQDADQ